MEYSFGGGGRRGCQQEKRHGSKTSHANGLSQFHGQADKVQRTKGV